MTTFNTKYAQLQPFALAGGGAITGDTSIVLQSMLDIDGNALSMSGTFGSKGFGTLDPGNGSLEEQISFTGLTNNTNGTTTLSGVSSVAFAYPYTESSGLSKTHAGATPFVISNTAGFYNQIVSKNDDATITGQYTFNTSTGRPQLSSDVDTAVNEELVDFGQLARTSFSGTVNASTSQKGIVQIATQTQVDAGTATGSTGALLTPTPALLRSKLLSDYVVDTGAVDAYVITPSPAIAAYTTGQIFSWKSTHTNTTTSTINVNGLGTKTIKKASGNNLAAGDIVSGQIVMIEYDGTNFQLLSDVAADAATQAGVQASSYVYAATSVGTDAYAITISPAIAAYAAGQRFLFKADVANTGGATLAVSGLTAQTIVKRGSIALNTNDILAGQIIDVTYDGTNFQMQTPVSNGQSYTSGMATRAGDTSNGAQTIAHGLGVVPSYVRITANKKIGSNAIANSVGLLSGSGTTCLYDAIVAATQDAGSDTSNGVVIHDDVSSAAVQSAVITSDATNITLTWTKAGSPTSANINIMWEAAARQ